MLRLWPPSGVVPTRIKVTATYVRDAVGRLVAEYGSTSPVYGTDYLTQDWLGSTRTLTTTAGLISKRFNYYPFGEEIAKAYGARTGDYGTATTAVAARARQ